MSSRLNLVRAWVSPARDFPFSIFDLMVNGVLRVPCTRIGPRFIGTIAEVDNYLVVKIRSVSTPLYWPRNLPLFDLYKVVTECFHEADWHFYEAPETRVSPGDVVLDCGAAEGIFSLRVVERVRHVVAFEPQPLFGDSLRRTFGHHANVTVVPCALSDVEGQAYLEGGSLYGTVTLRKGEPISVTTIDGWVEEIGHRVDFIKGDLEGFELKVLKGAVKTIRRDKPKIALTVYHPGNDWQEMLAHLRTLVPEYDYRIKGLSYNGGRARPVMLHCWPGKG